MNLVSGIRSKDSYVLQKKHYIAVILRECIIKFYQLTFILSESNFVGDLTFFITFFVTCFGKQYKK